jgi:hypothetical protein
VFHDTGRLANEIPADRDCSLLRRIKTVLPRLPVGGDTGTRMADRSSALPMSVIA